MILQKKAENEHNMTILAQNFSISLKSCNFENSSSNESAHNSEK